MSDIYPEQQHSWRLWGLAAITALTLHFGGAALAIVHLQDSDEAEGLGASGVEISFEAASPPRKDDQLPPGPDTNASVASPQLAEQKAEVKETERPKDKPNEDEVPDRIVTENESRKPKEDDPKIAAVQMQASTESVAQEETSQQTLDDNVPQADKAKAPNAGIDRDKQRLTAEWAKQLSAHFQKHEIYPDVDEKKRKKITVTVRLVLSRLGNVRTVEVWTSSGDRAYDQAAISMIRRSDPVPRPPAGLTDDVFDYTLPIHFSDKERKKK